MTTLKVLSLVEVYSLLMSPCTSNNCIIVLFHLLKYSSTIQSGIANEDSLMIRQKLKGDLRAVFSVLPKDMQQLLLMNPARETLLQETLDTFGSPEHPPAQQAGMVSSKSPR